MADTEVVLENRLPTSKKPKFKSIEKIMTSDDPPDLAFNGGGLLPMADTEAALGNRLPRSKKDKKKSQYTEELLENRLPTSKKPKFKSIVKIMASDDPPDVAFNGGGLLPMADTEAVLGNRLPRSKKDEKKRKHPEELLENRLPTSKEPEFKSIVKIMAGDDPPDLVFNGGRHLVCKGYGVPPFRLDDLKSFLPKLEKNKEELIGLLSSKKEDEKLRKILINQKDGNIDLGDCITFIWISLGILDVPKLQTEKEAEEFLLKRLELFQIEIPTEDDDTIFTTGSDLTALIKNLEEQVACITDLIRFLEVDGSTKVEMDKVIKKLFVLLEK